MPSVNQTAAFMEEDPRDLARRLVELTRQHAEIEGQIRTIRAAMDAATWIHSVPAASKKRTTWAEEIPRGTSTVGDLMRRFGRSKGWVYRKVKQGEIRNIKSLGVPYRFAPAEVERFEAGWKRRRE